MMARRDGIKYARVPTGSETCGWCFMLASKGFAYNSEGSAMSSHSGCDCVAVPGVDGDTVDGINFADLAKRWGEIVATVDNASLELRARRMWDAMGDAERARYRVALSRETQEFLDSLPPAELERMERLGIGKKGMDETAFKRFYQERLRIEACREAERRDAGWLYQGITGRVTKESGAKPLPKERELADLLSDNGFDVMFLKEINTSRVKTADAEIMGEIWEFKIPESWTDDKGVHTVRKQFFKALGKGTDKVVISNGMNKADFSEMINATIVTLESGDYAISEAIVADAKSGRIARLKK